MESQVINSAITSSSERQQLVLASPYGGDAAVYQWPLQEKNSKHDGSIEIVETIRWVFEDLPRLRDDIRAELSEFTISGDMKKYESMRSLCDKYNSALHDILKEGPLKRKPDARASNGLLKHIIQKSYNHAVADPDKLNDYKSWTPEVYGETSFEFIAQMLDAVSIKPDDMFIDLGSGVGHVVLQVAATVQVAKCIGIEKAETPVTYSKELSKQFRFWMKWFGKTFSEYELIKGDFFLQKYRTHITHSSFIFVNNYAFGPAVDHTLKNIFEDLKDGTRIVSSKAFSPVNFRITDRNLNDIGSMLWVKELQPQIKGSVSWTDKSVSYYSHTVDRSRLETYFLNRGSNKKSGQFGHEDEERRKKDRSRVNGLLNSIHPHPPPPPQPIKSQHNSFLSSSSDSSSDSSEEDSSSPPSSSSTKDLRTSPSPPCPSPTPSSCHKNKNTNSHSFSFANGHLSSPLFSSKEDTTGGHHPPLNSRSSSSSIDSKDSGHHQNSHSTMMEDKVVFGPTTRKAWKEWTSTSTTSDTTSHQTSGKGTSSSSSSTTGKPSSSSKVTSKKITKSISKEHEVTTSKREDKSDRQSMDKSSSSCNEGTDKEGDPLHPPKVKKRGRPRKYPTSIPTPNSANHPPSLDMMTTTSLTKHSSSMMTQPSLSSNYPTNGSPRTAIHPIQVDIPPHDLSTSSMHHSHHSMSPHVAASVPATSPLESLPPVLSLPGSHNKKKKPPTSSMSMTLSHKPSSVLEGDIPPNQPTIETKRRPGRPAKSPKKKGTPESDSLDILHQRTIQSYNDLRPTSPAPGTIHSHLPLPPIETMEQITTVTSAQVSPVPPREPARLIPYGCTLTHLMDMFQHQITCFLAMTQTDEYQAQVRQEIEIERARNLVLQSNIKMLEDTVTKLFQRGGLVLQGKLSELGIEDTTPGQVLAKAKAIIEENKSLTVQEETIKKDIQLQEELYQKILNSYEKKIKDNKLDVRLFRELTSSVEHNKKLYSDVETLENAVATLEKGIPRVGCQSGVVHHLTPTGAGACPPGVIVASTTDGHQDIAQDKGTFTVPAPPPPAAVTQGTMTPAAAAAAAAAVASAAAASKGMIPSLLAGNLLLSSVLGMGDKMTPPSSSPRSQGLRSPLAQTHSQSPSKRRPSSSPHQANGPSTAHGRLPPPPPPTAASTTSSSSPTGSSPRIPHHAASSPSGSFISPIPLAHQPVSSSKRMIPSSVTVPTTSIQGGLPSPSLIIGHGGKGAGNIMSSSPSRQAAMLIASSLASHLSASTANLAKKGASSSSSPVVSSLFPSLHSSLTASSGSSFPLGLTHSMAETTDPKTGMMSMTPSTGDEESLPPPPPLSLGVRLMDTMSSLPPPLGLPSVLSESLAQFQPPIPSLTISTATKGKASKRGNKKESSKKDSPKKVTPKREAKKKEPASSKSRKKVLEQSSIPISDLPLPLSPMGTKGVPSVESHSSSHTLTSTTDDVIDSVVTGSDMNVSTAHDHPDYEDQVSVASPEEATVTTPTVCRITHFEGADSDKPPIKLTLKLGLNSRASIKSPTKSPAAAKSPATASITTSSPSQVIPPPDLNIAPSVITAVPSKSKRKSKQQDGGEGDGPLTKKQKKQKGSKVITGDGSELDRRIRIKFGGTSMDEPVVESTVTDSDKNKTPTHGSKRDSPSKGSKAAAAAAALVQQQQDHYMLMRQTGAAAIQLPPYMLDHVQQTMMDQQQDTMMDKSQQNNDNSRSSSTSSAQQQQQQQQDGDSNQDHQEQEAMLYAAKKWGRTSALDKSSDHLVSQDSHGSSSMDNHRSPTHSTHSTVGSTTSITAMDQPRSDASTAAAASLSAATSSFQHHQSLHTQQVIQAMELAAQRAVAQSTATQGDQGSSSSIYARKTSSVSSSSSGQHHHPSGMAHHSPANTPSPAHSGDRHHIDHETSSHHHLGGSTTTGTISGSGLHHHSSLQHHHQSQSQSMSSSQGSLHIPNSLAHMNQSMMNLTAAAHGVPAAVAAAAASVSASHQQHGHVDHSSDMRGGDVRRSSSSSSFQPDHLYHDFQESHLSQSRPSSAMAPPASSLSAGGHFFSQPHRSMASLLSGYPLGNPNDPLGLHHATSSGASGGNPFSAIPQQAHQANSYSSSSAASSMGLAHQVDYSKNVRKPGRPPKKSISNDLWSQESTAPNRFATTAGSINPSESNLLAVAAAAGFNRSNVERLLCNPLDPRFALAYAMSGGATVGGSSGSVTGSSSSSDQAPTDYSAKNRMFCSGPSSGSSQSQTRSSTPGSNQSSRDSTSTTPASKGPSMGRPPSAHHASPVPQQQSHQDLANLYHQYNQGNVPSGDNRNDLLSPLVSMSSSLPHSVVMRRHDSATGATPFPPYPYPFIPPSAYGQAGLKGPYHDMANYPGNYFNTFMANPHAKLLRPSRLDTVCKRDFKNVFPPTPNLFGPPQ